MKFSRHEYWRGFPFPIAGDLPNAGTEPAFNASPALQATLPLVPLRNPEERKNSLGSVAPPVAHQVSGSVLRHVWCILSSKQLHEVHFYPCFTDEDPGVQSDLPDVTWLLSSSLRFKHGSVYSEIPRCLLYPQVTVPASTTPVYPLPPTVVLHVDHNFSALSGFKFD